MIDYTERISGLMRDIVSRVPRLGHIEPEELLVFARCGRDGANGAVATCHCLSLPPNEPGYYYWREIETGRITRCTPWFVTRSPRVTVRGRRLNYLISFALPRFCNQRLSASKKRRYYDGAPEWVAKLDTIVHELYHIDPALDGIRRVRRRTTSWSTTSANSSGASAASWGRRSGTSRPTRSATTRSWPPRLRRRFLRRCRSSRCARGPGPQSTRSET